MTDIKNNDQAILDELRETSQAVNQLVPIVKQNARSISEIATTVKSHGESIARIGQPKGISGGAIIGGISILIAFGVLLLSFVVAIGTLAMLPLRAADAKHADDIERGRQEFVEHIKDGHPKRVEQKADANTAAIVALDTNLQREMRDLDNGSKAELDVRLKSLDKQIQTEIANVIAGDKSMNESIGRILVWIDDHDKRVVGLNAAQWERIKSLERKVFGKAGNVDFGSPPGSTIEN